MSIPDADKVHARYANVERRLWNDTRGLSPLKPSGLGLWLYLLTTTYGGVMPGIIVAGEATMAEHLGWPLAAFRRCWAELEGQGMAVADWSARVVVLPKVVRNAIDRGHPESPNVVRGWRRQWREVPECALKIEYLCMLRDALVALGPAYLSALDAALSGPAATTPLAKEWVDPSDQGPPTPSRKDVGPAGSKPAHACSPNQEQDQEQDPDPPLAPPSGVGRPGGAGCAPAQGTLAAVADVGHGRETQRRGSRRRAAGPLPDGWKPNDAHRVAGQAMGLAGASFDEETSRFLDHHAAKGSVFVDWDAAFRTWLGNEKKWAKNRSSYRQRYVQTGDHPDAEQRMREALTEF